MWMRQVKENPVLPMKIQSGNKVSQFEQTWSRSRLGAEDLQIGSEEKKNCMYAARCSKRQ